MGEDIGFRLDPTIVPSAWVQQANRKGLGRMSVQVPTGVFTSQARIRFVELVQLLDQLMRRQNPFITCQDLFAELDRRSGSSGIALARLIASHARPGTDSPPETLLRLVLVDGGYRVPKVNYPITDSSGRIIRYADLALVEEMVDIEYQGKHHFDGAASVHRDRERRQDLDRLRWQLVEVVWSDFANPSAIYRRVDDALIRARKLAA